MTINKITFSTLVVLAGMTQLAYGQIKITARQLDSLVARDQTIQIVDVRTPGEVASGFIKKAILIDYSTKDFSQKINQLDKSKPIIVYCGAGGRSGKSAIQLKELGFKQIYDLTGGMNDWKAKQKPVELAK